QHALNLEPRDTGLMLSAADVAKTLGRFEEAIRLCANVVQLDPLDYNAYMQLGFYSYYAGRLDDAKNAYKKALELNPAAVARYVGLGRIYLAQNQPQAALSAIEQETEPAWRLYGLALAYSALGRESEAQEALKKVIQNYSEVGAFQIAQVHAFR